MSDAPAAGQAQEAVRLLRQKWEQTARDWRDDAARAFEAEQVRELAGWGEATQHLAASMESILDNARRTAP